MRSPGTLPSQEGSFVAKEITSPAMTSKIPRTISGFPKLFIYISGNIFVCLGCLIITFLFAVYAAAVLLAVKSLLL